MKIQYLQEGYIKSVDKMKDIAGKKHTADDIRKETKKILLEPVLKMLEDSEFLRKCGNCVKHFVHPDVGTYLLTPHTIKFKYETSICKRSKRIFSHNRSNTISMESKR